MPTYHYHLPVLPMVLSDLYSTDYLSLGNHEHWHWKDTLVNLSTKISGCQSVDCLLVLSTHSLVLPQWHCRMFLLWARNL